MDYQWETESHNPARFTISMPNSTRTNKVWRICANTLVVPRMFPNIYAPDNTLQWYRRKVLELKTATPNQVFRTVDPEWTLVRTVTFPDGIWNTAKILAHLNTDPNEVWSFDEDSQSFVVTVTPSGVPIEFGVFNDFVFPENPPTVYADMAYIVEPPGTHVFDVLGFERAASQAANAPGSRTFVPTDPNTFDSVTGTNLGMRNVFPLFDRSLHSYADWATDVYASPPNNQPNLAGPVIVHVSLADIGDSSTVDAKTGGLQDILTSINLGDVAFGTFKERTDDTQQGIQYQQARNLTNISVALLDVRNRQLRLPRNFPVFLKLQMIHTLD